MAFLIIAGVILVVNILFLLASILYTLRTSKGKNEPRLSTLGSEYPRMSLQPQVVFYQAIVRISGNPSLDHHHKEHPHPITTITEKIEITDNQTKQA